MSTSFSRREFLSRGAAATAILGFPFLTPARQIGKPAKPANPPPVDLLALARQRMKQENKPGVVIVVPPEPAQAKLADDLARLLGVGGEACKQDVEFRGKGVHILPIGGGSATAQVLFCQAVFVCVPFEQLRQQAPELRPDVAAILLDLDGKGLAVLKSEPELFGKDFAAKMGEFLHGSQGERLATAVKAQRAALGPAQGKQFDAAVRDLDADAFPVREAASKQLAELAPRATALLAEALKGAPSLEVRCRITRLFDELYAAAPHGRPGPRMPYGVAWDTQRVDACPGCGLGVMPAGTRLFLRFATDKEKK